MSKRRNRNRNQKNSNQTNQKSKNQYSGSVKTAQNQYEPIIEVRDMNNPSETRTIPYSQFMNSISSNRIQLRNLASNNERTPTFNKYTKSQLIRYLSNPYSNEKQLRQMSKYLCNISNYYRRLLDYLSTLPTLAYIIIPSQVSADKVLNINSADPKFLKQYLKVTQELERMNIRNEFQKVLYTGFQQDVFYGICWESKDSFAIQQLDADYCKISSIEDGVFNFAFNFQYFDSYSSELPNYPQEIQSMYNTYKSQGNDYKWQEIGSDIGICIKVNDESIVPIPPFVSLFSALADIEDYRAASKDSTEQDNYKILNMKIPIDDSTGDFLIDEGIAKRYYSDLCSQVPDSVGVALSPMPIDALSFEKAGAMASDDLVSQAENSFWNQSGVNRLLFGGGDKQTANTLKMSVTNDENLVFRVVRQIERWINRRIQSLSGNYKFKMRFLEITRYNQKEQLEYLFKSAQYGLPVRTALMAAQDYEPNDIAMLQVLENSVLNLSANEIPLTSANVQSSKVQDTNNASSSKTDTAGDASNADNNGRPKNESVDKSITDSTETSNETNNGDNNEV